MSEIEIFIKSHNDVLSILIGVLGIILSLCGVIFGIKSYRVAKDIFEKGLQLDKEMVLQQVSLEFVTGFFIPMKEFNAVIQPFLNDYCNKDVIVVTSLIRNVTFSIHFPYFDSHQGEIWNSLSICNDMDQAEAFNTIIDFVKKAREFVKTIADLNDNLRNYLNPKTLKDRNRRVQSKLNDFFAANPNVNREQFQKGINMIKELLEYEEKLPKELKISQMRKSLWRDK